MLTYKIKENEGIVVIEPSGALEQADFENLTKDLDAYINKNKNINGVIIQAKGFPGWKDFDSFFKHIKFIKDHHKKVKRVAIVTDSKFLSSMPTLANLFVSAEVKHFSYDDLDIAEAWIKKVIKNEKAKCEK